MQKIISREEKARKEKRNQAILGIILVGIMVLSTAGYALFSKEKKDVKKLEYKGLNFVLQEDNLWHTNIQNYDFATTYNPEETENITGFLTLNIQSYVGKPLYFSYDSERIGIVEIARNLERFAERINSACLDDCKENYPVKNCSENIIIIKDLNETLIRQEDNCVYIFAKGEDVTRASDAFVFKILGL